MRELWWIAGGLLFVLGMIPGCGPPPQPVEEISADNNQPDAAPISVSSDDWPWWRGPGRNNVAPCDTAPTQWADSKNVAWKSSVRGRGHGSPTVVGERIYLASCDEVSEHQLVVCYQRNSGEQIWETAIHQGELPSLREMHPKSTHANGTVACDGMSLFIGFLNREHIFATSLTLDGEIRWQTDLGPFLGRFGYAPSPCLHESLAIFAADNNGGSFLAAVHRQTGDIVWRKARSNVNTYSSPIVAEIGGRSQLLISGDQQIVSYDPMTGEELWSCPGGAEGTCGTLVWLDHLVFASGGYPQNETICVDASKAERVWVNNIKCYEQSLLVANELVFGFTDQGIMMCWDARTGERRWRERLKGPVSASPVLVGNHVYATNEAGSTWVFEASAKGYEEVAHNQLGSESFASLTICDGKIYTRVATGRDADRQEYLYCLQDERADSPDAE